MYLYTKVLRNQYHDSVALMLAAKALKQREQVTDAAFMMGTEINKDLLRQGKLLDENAEAARANDLVIAVKCQWESPDILTLAENLLSTHTPTQPSSPEETETLRGVLRSHPQANMVLISIGGTYASREGREALANGANVFLFSDNVTLADEVALKKLALDRGLLLMGPGAGTAIINGIGLGFANQVPPGDIGIVSAAGTGLQEVSTLLAKQGLGISQAIGTGGRDLNKAVGGLMFFASIDALQADPNTRMIILISKPPDADLVEQLIAKVKGSEKPVILCLLGAEKPDGSDPNLHFTRTLEECALVAENIYTSSEQDITENLAEADRKLLEKYHGLKDKFAPGQKYIRGLYSGGTLCFEAQVIWREVLSEPVLSNAPLTKDRLLEDSSSCRGHCALDLGEEEFTLGRPHPMIDNELRIERMAKEAQDPQTAIILFDTVLGYGAHPDPAEEIGSAIQKIGANHPNIVWISSITGAEDDPQSLSKTKQELEDAGVIVCDSNAQAARLAANLLQE